MTLADLRKIIDGEVPPPPVSQLIGFRLVDAEEGRVTFIRGAFCCHDPLTWRLGAGR